MNSEQSEAQKEQKHSNEHFEETVNNIGFHILGMGVKLRRPGTNTTTSCTAR